MYGWCLLKPASLKMAPIRIPRHHVQIYQRISRAFKFFSYVGRAFDIPNENIFIRVPLNYLALKWFGGVCSTISSIKRLFVLVFALRLMGDRVLFIKMIAAVIYWQSRKWNANIHNSFLYPAISNKLSLKFTYWLPATNIWVCIRDAQISTLISAISNWAFFS